MNLQSIACAAALAMGGAAASACPDYNAYGATYEATGAQLTRGASFDVLAGGDNELNACGVVPLTDRGRGYVTSSPDFSFSLSGMGGYRLVLSVVSECDSVLLINTGAVNWYYDDDDNGNLDARMVLTQPSNGWLDVWVGTHDGAVCNAALALATAPG